MIIYTCIHTYTHIHVYIHIYTCRNAGIDICVHTYSCACTKVSSTEELMLDLFDEMWCSWLGAIYRAERHFLRALAAVVLSKEARKKA